MNVKVKELDKVSFEKYGIYADMLNPQGPHLGQAPCSFYRDMGVLTLNHTQAGFSITRVEKRPYIVDELEYHDTTGEAILPLDGDVYMQVAPAGPHGKPDAASVEVYRVKKGTLVILKPGTWHTGPLCAGENPVNILVVLPERTYAVDCVIEKMDPLAIEV